MSPRNVSLTEAKAHLSSLVNAAAYGKQTILILSHGKPKAALVGLDDMGRPEGAMAREPAADLIADIEAFGQRLKSRGRKWTPVVKTLHRVRKERTKAPG